MKRIPWRTQLDLVALVYAAVVGITVVLILDRYLQYVNNPADAVASGGMYAGGDMLLEAFIGCLFLVPTLLLVLVIRHAETVYTSYAKILLGLSLTAPLSAGLLSIPAVSQGTSSLGYICLYRLFASPFIIAAFGLSRFFARFRRPKRLTSYAGLIEVLTLLLLVALLFVSAKVHG